MYIYRPHRGSLNEAMAEKREFPDLQSMKEFIVSQWLSLDGSPLFSPDDIIIGESVINDSRIGWQDCRHVLVTRIGDPSFPCPMAIGWCATIYPRT